MRKKKKNSIPRGKEPNVATEKYPRTYTHATDVYQKPPLPSIKDFHENGNDEAIKCYRNVSKYTYYRYYTSYSHHSVQCSKHSQGCRSKHLNFPFFKKFNMQCL